MHLETSNLSAKNPKFYEYLYSALLEKMGDMPMGSGQAVGLYEACR